MAGEYPSLHAYATSWCMCCIVLKVIWYYSRDYGFVAKFADFPDEYDVAADTRDTLKSALLEWV